MKANNIVGDTWDYADPNINEGAVGFPAIQVDSAWSNTAGPPMGTTTLLSLGQADAKGSPVVLTWSYIPSGDQAGFTIQRATDAAFTKGLKEFNVGASATSFSDDKTKGGTTYYYRVVATNSLGSGTWSNALSIVPHA